MKNKIRTIRTGGQSGVDRAAMDIARKYHIPICGWCPKNGWAEDYPEAPGLLADYPELTETQSYGTSERTRLNMRDADAILTIMPTNSSESKGTEIGIQEGITLIKPMLTVNSLKETIDIIDWLSGLPDELDLAIGGPRASECPEGYQIASDILENVILYFL